MSVGEWSRLVPFKVTLVFVSGGVPTQPKLSLTRYSRTYIANRDTGSIFSFFFFPLSSLLLSRHLCCQGSLTTFEKHCLGVRLINKIYLIIYICTYRYLFNIIFNYWRIIKKRCFTLYLLCLKPNRYGPLGRTKTVKGLVQ